MLGFFFRHFMRTFHTLTNLILGIILCRFYLSFMGDISISFFPKVLLSNNNILLCTNLLLVSFPWSFQVCRSMCDQISGAGASAVLTSPTFHSVLKTVHSLEQVPASKTSSTKYQQVLKTVHCLEQVPPRKTSGQTSELVKI